MSERICSVVDCPRPVKGRGLCDKHWKRWWRHGTTELTRVPGAKRKRCSVEGCERVADARGLCPSHYYRWWRYGDQHRPAKQPLLPEQAQLPIAEVDADQAAYVAWLGT